MAELASNETLKNLIELLVAFPFRLRHRLRAREKRRVRIETLKTVRKTLAGASKLNAANVKIVFNVGLYLLLLDQDLAFFTDDLVCAVGDRRRAFVAKHEAMMLYEAAEDLPQLLGREFRDAVKTLGARPEQLERLNKVSSDLNRFWQKQRDFLGAIRNALAAHRDHDALRYAESLEALKPLEVMARGAELSPLLDRLIRVLTEIAHLTVGPAAILRDVLVSKKKP